MSKVPWAMTSDNGEGDSDYNIGDRVYHAKWGRGKIMNVNGRGTNMRVTVKFDSGREKILMIEYAKLQKI